MVGILASFEMAYFQGLCYIVAGSVPLQSCYGRGMKTINPERGLDAEGTGPVAPRSVTAVFWSAMPLQPEPYGT